MPVAGSTRRAALRRSIGLLLLTSVAAGCTSLLPGTERGREKTVYVLSPPRTVTDAGRSGGCGTIIVAAPTAAPGYDTSRMAYIEQPYRIDYFAFHSWADAPSRMLEPLLVEALDSAGVFRHVVAGSMPVAAGWRLDTEVLQLAQHFTEERSEVVLSVRARLTGFDPQRVLGSRTFRIVEPAGRDPYGGAVAANRAAGRLLKQLVDFVTARRGTACEGRET